MLRRFMRGGFSRRSPFAVLGFRVRSSDFCILASLDPVRLAAIVARKSTSFHGADGADALQGIGQQWSETKKDHLCVPSRNFV